jgi:MFS transporter, PAT family, beta-lactamase induction signal transducer AmpG
MAVDAAAASATAAPWRDQRFPVLLALGFAAGLPFPLVAGQVLRQWFAESGLSLAAIGMTALIGLAYANKFLWSPALDALPPPPPLGRLGQRRGWLATIQVLLMASICAVGLTNPVDGAALTVALATLVAFLSASQDIVVDAYRIEVLPDAEREQAWGLTAYVWGYRLALLASGAGTLFLVGRIGWAGAYAAAAALLSIGLAATLLGPEPRVARQRLSGWAERLRASVLDPFLQFTGRPYWLAILLFVGLFKLGEALAGVMTTPFYRSLGFTREEVAAVSTVFGMVATLLGALAGAWLVPRVGTGRALVVTGLGQMLSNLMYVALARAGHDMPMLWAQVGIESFTDGLADAAFLTYLSGLTSRAFTATQYALLSSLAAVPLRTLGAGSGWLAEALGWPGFFLLTTAAALPAMALMLWLLGRLPPAQEDEARRGASVAA